MSKDGKLDAIGGSSAQTMIDMVLNTAADPKCTPGQRLFATNQTLLDHTHTYIPPTVSKHGEFVSPGELTFGGQKTLGPESFRLRVNFWVLTHSECIGPYSGPFGNIVTFKGVVLLGNAGLDCED